LREKSQKSCPGLTARQAARDKHITIEEETGQGKALA
jgi:hypothetical protein